MSNLDLVENILTHVGVKGMRWGVRTQRVGDTAVGGLGISTTGSRKRASTRDAKKKTARAEVRVSDKRKKLKTSGGKGLPAHPDALRARKLDQVVKKSGTKALSNEDLRAYSNRLQLEQNVSRLNSNDKSVGVKASKLILSRAGNKLVDEALNASARSVKKTIYRMIN